MSGDAPGPLLLDMACAARPPDDRRLAALGGDEWDALDASAAEHRLQPLLHHRLAGVGAVPAPVRARWREAYRFAALSTLAHRAELAACVALLGRHGLSPLALKGAYLAAHVYPDPALRPLRDIDLLLPADQLAEALRVLCAAGCVAEPRPGEAIDVAACLHRDKHLPPLRSPRGIVIELHHRLWEVDGVLDHASPRADDGGVHRRAIAAAGIAYPHPADTLVHVIVHAVYSHRFDCGPLALWDVRHLVARSPVDWDAFWRRGRVEGWDTGASLLVALVRHYHGAAIIAPSKLEPAAPPAAMIAAAQALLLQPMASRRSAGAAAAAMAGGVGALVQRMAGRRGADAPLADRSRRVAGRAAATSRDLMRPAVRQQSRRLLALSRWLDGQAPAP